MHPIRGRNRLIVDPVPPQHFALAQSFANTFRTVGYWLRETGISFSVRVSIIYFAASFLGSSMVTKAGVAPGYGMGWETRPLDGKYVISHDGVQPGTSTHLFVFPSRHLSIAVAANLQHIDLTAFASRLFESITGEAWQLAPYIRPSLRPPYEDAIPLLQSAVSLHPGDANLRDTLGEFYVRTGAREKALLAYRQALEINPNYPNASAAKEQIRELSRQHGDQQRDDQAK